MPSLLSSHPLFAGKRLYMGRFDPDAEGKGRFMAALAYDAALLVKDSVSKQLMKAKSKQLSPHTMKWLNFRGEVWGFNGAPLKLLSSPKIETGISR